MHYHKEVGNTVSNSLLYKFAQYLALSDKVNTGCKMKKKKNNNNPAVLIRWPVLEYLCLGIFNMKSILQ